VKNQKTRGRKNLSLTTVSHMGFWLKYTDLVQSGQAILSGRKYDAFHRIQNFICRNGATRPLKVKGCSVNLQKEIPGRE
jgi:hypothetical protein